MCASAYANGDLRTRESRQGKERRGRILMTFKDPRQVPDIITHIIVV